jgi:hypothetical protein
LIRLYTERLKGRKATDWEMTGHMEEITLSGQIGLRGKALIPVMVSEFIFGVVLKRCFD